MSLCDNRFSAQALAALVRVVGRVSDTEVVEIATATATGQRFIRLTFAASSLPGGRLEKVLCIGAALETVTPDERSLLGDRRHRTALAEVPDGSAGDGADVGQPLDYDIKSILGVVIASSSRNSYPFSLLRCKIGGLVGIDESHGIEVARSLDAVCEARLNQRLRPSDRVIRGERGTYLVVAEHLGDEQDAAGVAYRLLAAMVEPVMFDDEYFELPLTVGIAVADGTATIQRILDASVHALTSAMGRGSGGFSIVDIRPGLAA
ncbi:MAG TPA: diguanylate cyclase [Microthrixaceae bacterium]|nr:diguanylate cyclase [Microthrixaceae bacterium]